MTKLYWLSNIYNNKQPWSKLQINLERIT